MCNHQPDGAGGPPRGAAPETCRTRAPGCPVKTAPLRLTGSDHIAFSVPDLVAAERWYVDVLGAEVVGRYNWGGDSSHPVAPHEDIRIGSHIVSLKINLGSGSIRASFPVRVSARTFWLRTGAT